MKIASCSFALIAVLVAGCDKRDIQSTQTVDSTTNDVEPHTTAHVASNTANVSLAIFEKRILPVFQSPNPSSCAECHLSGVDLKEYIRPTQQETFASLVGAGMINVQNPEESKILKFISRSPQRSTIINETVRQEEYAAFRDWILAAVADPQLIADGTQAGPIGPQVSDEVIRHARQDRVLTSFIENIWTEVGRCAACHSPDRNQKQVKEHGEQVSWITLDDPEITLTYMIEHQLIDPKSPPDSLLLQKPTMQVEHGGGQKMVVGDRSYKQFRRFIDDYAAIVKGQYRSTEELPKPHDEVSLVTDIWLKIEGVPARFDKMLLQVDLYRKTDSGWSEQRVATSDRPIFGGGNLWQHSLSLIAQRGTTWATEIDEKKLPAGRYLAKIYIDRTARLQNDLTAEVGDEEFIGEVELESQWPTGYGRMTVISFPAE